MTGALMEYFAELVLGCLPLIAGWALFRRLAR